MTKRKLMAKFACVRSASDTRIEYKTGKEIRKMTRALFTPIDNIRRSIGEKKNLPAVVWAAKFSDDKRHAETAEPTGLAYIDIDHISQWATSIPADIKDKATALYCDKFAGLEDELGIVHAQISPSGDGLHIVFIPENGGSIEEAQKAFAEKAGLEQYDTQCHDISRLLFLSHAEDTLYDVLDTLYDE